ncbi:MAG: tol-pal system-associated acyl-CoA thioesterase [Paracoccaceae bacterium]|uniref:Tol-pal system-associated acyl-CoA thioesterase n=1 Tax=Pseudothioclava arenosa TaxID=1795308 RepID=A0A2A4CTA5_9RHOB|nr:tol-pal system-associated acyl-CoA thioesterase [Pseudothioclava arenosa]PCD77815.1 tol-pal system-associated acyl-CoA thioesterase [Pseudothioclava arenosa]
MAHEFPVRVYYEDTDLAGIVYYANYLKFIERGRTEWVRELGIDQGALRRDAGIVFAVRAVEADYLRSAKFDDELIVRTALESETGARITVLQSVWRGEEKLFEARVVLVCMNEEGSAARLPADIRAKFSPALH